MKSTNPSRATSMLARLGVAVAVLAAGLMLGGTGCAQGAEGDRCNPNLSHNDCNAGLTCTQPAGCPENYCCPTNGMSSNPYCQPGCAVDCTTDPNAPVCASPEAGAEAASMAPETGSPETGGGG
jgi:hypothetical protein